jgi:AcrR family transcriptional regulator
MTPAERRRERLRLRIIDVADGLYRENGGENGGFENTKVEVIAEQSDISLRTFFRYFESKADVIYLDPKGSVLRLRESLQPRLEHEPPAMAMFNARIDQFNWITSTAPRRERLLRALRAPQFRDRLIIMREANTIAVAEMLAPYMSGDAGERMLRARLMANLDNDLFTMACDKWVENQGLDLVAYIRDWIALLPGIVAAMSASIPAIPTAPVRQRSGKTGGQIQVHTD